MAYRDDISGLGADHHWDFDGDSLDQIGSVDGTDTSIIYTDSAIAKDATNCATMNDFADRISLPSANEINNTSQARKAVCGWFEVTSIQAHPVRIYGEGSQGTNFQLCMGYGNNLIFECAETTNFPKGLQVYGPVAQPNRVYHLCGIFLGNTAGNEIKFFVDGVEQFDADPADRQPDDANLNNRSVGIFGKPTSTTGLGGSIVLQQSAIDGRYQHWVTWGDEADANLTNAEVRGTLFERGALAEQTVSTGTEAAMQTTVDGYSAQPDAACCIEVEAVTGGGDFTLTASLDFDDLASIHIRYNGTADTLTWVNTGAGNASIGSAPFGGSIILATRQTLTVKVLDATTLAAISGARVYIEADTGGDLSAGTEIMSATTNGSGIATATHDFTSEQPIIGRVRKGSSAPYYKSAAIGGPLGSVPLNTTILMVPD